MNTSAAQEPILSPSPAGNAASAATAASEFTILHREAHRLLRLNRDQRDMHWVSGLISVAIAAAEMPSAALEFPCVMTRGTDGGGRLLAITGLEHGRNLFVDAQGHWSGNYLPAVLRTWPFRLLTEVDDEGARLVAVHRPALSVSQGDALFDEQGKETPWLQALLRELVALDAAASSTAEQVAALDAAGLLHERSLQAILPGGRQLELTGFLSVDETKLNALEPAVAGELHRKGALSLAYLHLLSLRRFRPLMERAAALEPQAVADTGASAAQASFAEFPKNNA
ncbi:MAG: hypothetical protein E6Q49_02240 [Limnohabitans sp.]|nr:MAG: hypothetical protein E6Q49_02240 [Limnohabitans sp.]